MAQRQKNSNGGCHAASPTPTSRDDLVNAWEEAHGRPPPKGIGSRLLALSAAYHRQAYAQGGLRPDTRAQLMAIAGGGAQPEPEQKVSALAGTRLVRDWRGETHVVDVMDEGVLYRGETFRSLSQVAQRITGAKWSGPRFFGISSR
ncbi:MAG: DUF2924 domain-containing protein [Alphaproteobacteria bacterium]